MAQILISLFDTHSRAVDAKSALLAIGVKPECIELHAGPTEHPSDTQTRDGLAELPETDRLERFSLECLGAKKGQTKSDILMKASAGAERCFVSSCPTNPTLIGLVRPC
jgi:hypothetical protein